MPLGPNQQQQANALNPQATTIYTPSQGIFRAVGNNGVIYKDNGGGNIQTFDLAELGKQELIRQNPTKDANGNYVVLQGNNYGSQVEVGQRIAKEKYGLDFNSLPQVNWGDYDQQLAKQGYGYQTPEGSHVLPGLQASTDINQFVTAAPSTLSGSQINNTPNQLASDSMYKTAGLLTQAQLQGSQGQNVQLDANGNAINTPLGQSSGGAPVNSNNAGGISVGGAYGTPAGEPNLSGLPPEFQQLYSQLEQYLQKLQANGQILNPNIELTPEKIAEFLAQAHSEIDPYYSNVLKIAQEGLTRNSNYALGELANNEAQLQSQYGRSLRSLGENAADQGFAQSGLRQRDEQQLASDTQNTLDTNRRQLQFGAGTDALNFAGTYGGANLPAQSMSTSPRVLAGESNFTSGGGTQPLYSLSGSILEGLKGTSQYQQEADVRNRSSQLEQAFNSNNAVDQARKLTI